MDTKRNIIAAGSAYLESPMVTILQDLFIALCAFATTFILTHVAIHK